MKNKITIKNHLSMIVSIAIGAAVAFFCGYYLATVKAAQIIAELNK